MRAKTKNPVPRGDAGRASEMFCLAAEHSDSTPSATDWEARAAADWVAAHFHISPQLARLVATLAGLRRAFG